MALGTAAILGLGSVAGAVVQGRAASNAADAQSDAASEANETQRYIFDQQVALTEPQRVMGQNALAALGFEAGIAPLPTFGGTQMGNGQAIDGFAIEEIPGQGGNVTFQGNFGSNDGMTAFVDGQRISGDINSNADMDRIRAMYGGQGGQSSFRVGDQTFGTRQEAEAFVNSQPAMGPQTTGGMQYTPIQFPDDPNTGIDAFEASPGYQFRLDEGMKAIERAAAARGLRLSGSTLMDSARFGQGLASDEFGRFYGRQVDQYGREYAAATDDYARGYNQVADQRNLLSSIAGIGQTATQQQIGAGTNFANATSGNLLNMGSAQAQGYMGRADAVTGGINNLSNIYGMGMSGYLGQNPGLGIKPVANPFGG
jgi:hypothetical protein